MFAGARRGNMPTCWALINEETESPRVTVLFHVSCEFFLFYNFTKNNRDSYFFTLLTLVFPVKNAQNPGAFHLKNFRIRR